MLTLLHTCTTSSPKEKKHPSPGFPDASPPSTRLPPLAQHPHTTPSLWPGLLPPTYYLFLTLLTCLACHACLTFSSLMGLLWTWACVTRVKEERIALERDPCRRLHFFRDPICWQDIQGIQTERKHPCQIQAPPVLGVFLDVYNVPRTIIQVVLLLC